MEDTVVLADVCAVSDLTGTAVPDTQPVVG